MKPENAFTDIKNGALFWFSGKEPSCLSKFLKIGVFNVLIGSLFGSGKGAKDCSAFINC